MIIKTNNKEIDVKSVIADKIQRNGKTYPALKFLFNSEVTGEDIAALTSGKINIEKHVYSGYNTVGEISVTIGKITTAEQERDEIAAVLETTKQERDEIAAALETTKFERDSVAATLTATEQERDAVTETLADTQQTLETTKQENTELQEALNILLEGGN